MQLLRGKRQNVIDLTEHAKPTWQRPTECPSCQTRSQVDFIDLVDGQVGHHCPSCDHRFVTRR